MNPVNVSMPVFSHDSQVAKCFVWRNPQGGLDIPVNVEQATQLYPQESVYNAVQALAAQVFKLIERMNNENNTNHFSGYQ